MAVSLCSLFLLLTTAESTHQPFIWPLPQQFTVSDSPNLNVNESNFTFIQNIESEIIEAAFDRYKKIIFQHRANGFGNSAFYTIDGVSLLIKDSSEDTLSVDMDESYSLIIPSFGSIATLSANTVWGALRGLETLSQLIVFNAASNYYECFASNISDYPRFAHRGLLVDSARHFLPIWTIKNVLDSMSFAKFNVLHWHMTDSQSFPFESMTFPKLWNGAYSVYERYTQNDVKDIVDYAKNLGIRIIPEFDVPGHADSWCIGYPDLCPSKDCTSPLDVSSDTTWKVLSALIGEVADLFIDDFIHLGGDEVNTRCWTKTEAVNEWMNANNFNATLALQYFDERVIDIANANGKTVIDWDETFSFFSSSIDPKQMVVQIWHSDNLLLPNVVKNGFRAIYSPNSEWYLNLIDHSWESRYAVEPLVNISDANQQKLVIGGEACCWGNAIDASDILQTIWPSGAAVAERLWSDRSTNSTQNAEPRLEYFRCLLNERGIPAAPTNNNVSAHPPPRVPPSQLGSCYDLRR